MTAGSSASPPRYTKTWALWANAVRAASDQSNAWSAGAGGQVKASGRRALSANKKAAGGRDAPQGLFDLHDALVTA